jgi:DNA invertase Pin-like site-specific DNA recombinase
MSKPKLALVPTAPRIRTYGRISKGDPDADSLANQDAGAEHFTRDDLPRLFGVRLPWSERVRYADHDVARDDFEGRADLQGLLREVNPGDVVIVRDQDRLGAGAETVTVMRKLRERGARVFAYKDKAELKAGSAVDDFTTYARGFAAQLEVENIRSRTTEGIRARVNGRKDGSKTIGGGKT